MTGKIPVECHPTRVCEVLVGLGDVEARRWGAALLDADTERISEVCALGLDERLGIERRSLSLLALSHRSGECRDYRVTTRAYAIPGEAPRP